MAVPLFVTDVPRTRLVGGRRRGEAERPQVREKQLGQKMRSGRFFQEGEYWTMELGEAVVRVRGSRGMQYLASLLARPNEVVSAGVLFHAARRPSLALNGGSLSAPRRAKEKQPAGNRYATESERVAVTRALRAAIGQIAQQDLGLATYLNQSLRTGQLCVYAPALGRLIRWHVRAAASAQGLASKRRIGPRDSCL